MGWFGDAKLTEDDSGNTQVVVVGDSAVTDPNQWASYPGGGGGAAPPPPGYSPPPLVSATPSTGSATDWFGTAKTFMTGVVDIFGRPQGQPVVVQPQPGLPLWGWVAIGVGGVVVLGVVARGLRKSKSTAGYRHRRHRRSRR